MTNTHSSEMGGGGMFTHYSIVFVLFLLMYFSCSSLTQPSESVPWLSEDGNGFMLALPGLQPDLAPMIQLCQTSEQHY